MDLFSNMETDLEAALHTICQAIKDAPSLKEQVETLNTVRRAIHDVSPFANEPVDCVLWKLSENVHANDYNPNKVAPPEMELLEVSIMNDGYTQPIVTWPKEETTAVEVIDGFHRSRVGRESTVVKDRVKGFLPTVVIRKAQEGKNDRIASTIRHNRARGKHQIDAMSEIVIELKNRNWTNKRVARELGMDEDEVLRLCQITGLEHLFSDADFSKAWEAEDSIALQEFTPVNDQLTQDQIDAVRTANTNDPNRKFHTYDKWECVKAGLWLSSKPGMTKDECQQAYAEFVADPKKLKKGLKGVIKDWKYSCEQNLLNIAMNRLAWLIQSATCYEIGIPKKFSIDGWELLTGDQQDKAYELALEFLNKWLKKNKMDSVEFVEAVSDGRQVEIY